MLHNRNGVCIKRILCTQTNLYWADITLDSQHSSRTFIFKLCKQFFQYTKTYSLWEVTAGDSDLLIHWLSWAAHTTQSVNNSLTLRKNMFNAALVQLTWNKPDLNFQQHNFPVDTWHVTSEKICPRNVCRLFVKLMCNALWCIMVITHFFSRNSCPPLRLLPIKETMAVWWTTRGREIGGICALCP